MRNTSVVLALSFCLPLTGCMSSLRVKSANVDLTKPKGLPFYAKVGACRQETVWLEYRYEISAIQFGPVFLNQTSYNAISKDLSGVGSAEVLQAVMKERGIANVDPFVSDETSKDVHDAKGSKNLVLGANTADLVAIVDYSHPMWLNSGRPLAGTTQVSGKFGEDGTLTESSAQVDNQTLSTILTAVTSLVGSVAPKTAFDGGSQKPFVITVKVSARAHTHTKMSLMNAGNKGSETLPVALQHCTPSSPIEDGSWVITDALQPPANPAKKADDKPAADKKP